jgi:hypothetical protein
MADRWLHIIQQVHPQTARPWRLLETIDTVDGPRTRVCDGCFTSREEAEWEYNSKHEKPE